MTDGRTDSEDDRCAVDRVHCMTDGTRSRMSSAGVDRGATGSFFRDQTNVHD
jgi:hypothetical protein